jgi:hypothetical protein
MVGRIAAIKNDAHNREHADRVGFFGFFESADEQRVANALFAAAAWFRAPGGDMLRGPMSPSINDECGLPVEGFQTPPTLMMPHNPPYYSATDYRSCRSFTLRTSRGRLSRRPTAQRRRAACTLRPIPPLQRASTWYAPVPGRSGPRPVLCPSRRS